MNTLQRYAIPEPEVKIGQVVRIGTLDADTREWMYRQFLRAEIKHFRKYQRKFNLGRGKLIPNYKDRIRSNMNVYRTAYAVQVAGLVPLYGLSTMKHSVTNQCYIPGVQGAASPMQFGAVLLFRAEVDADWSPAGNLDQRGPHKAFVSLIGPKPMLLYKKNVEDLIPEVMA